MSNRDEQPDAQNPADATPPPETAGRSDQGGARGTQAPTEPLRVRSGIRAGYGHVRGNNNSDRRLKRAIRAYR